MVVLFALAHIGRNAQGGSAHSGYAHQGRPQPRLAVVTSFRGVAQLIVHLRHSGLIRQNRHLFIRRQHIVGAGPIRYLGHGVIAYAQALDEDFAVFIRFEGLVVAVGPGHAEGEALHLAVAGRFFNPQGASLGHVGETNPGLVLYLVNLAVLGDLHIIGVFIQQEALRRFGFPYEHAAVEANAAGILYNKDLFEENGWKVPTTWQEFTTLCDEIKQSGTLPLYLGFKDTWTCLAPWNALAVGLTDSDTCNQVNMGNTTFSDTYGPVAEKMRALLDYAEKNPYAYGYNDACTAFARGESAMYPIGSYAIPQIKSVNPDMNIGSFTFPANDEESDNVLNSGIDLQFSVMKACKNKEAAYEVLKYLYDDETIQIYLDDQGGIACKDGDFAIPETLKDMRPYIENNRMADYQDHHYPSEMSVDAMIQTFLLDTSDNAQEKFLKKFDSDWKRYNRDLIRKVQDYQKEQEDAQ